MRQKFSDGGSVMASATHVMDVSSANFEQEVVSRSFEQPVVVDFWAPWCGPCRTLGPTLERLAGEANGAYRLVKLNTDENQDLAMRYGIRGIPAVKAFRDGKVVAEFVGAQPEPNVRRFLDQFATTGASGAQAEAQRLLSERRWAEAEVILREQDANGNAANLDLARALLGQGKGAEADGLLQAVTDHTDLAAAGTLRPLAQLVAEVDDGELSDSEADALLRDASRLFVEGRYGASMDALLTVVRRDKRYRNDTPRKVMLGIFQFLGEQDPLTREYRNRLASALF
jgi:putative thioredoxin